MTKNYINRQSTREIEIDFLNMQDIMYWAKKWEVTPHQLIEVHNTIKSNKVKKIESHLRAKGFAL